jgi:hypothetical protein
MNSPSNTAAIVAVVIAVIAVAALVWIYTRNKRTSDLRQKFGPEYERALHEHGDARHAEADLRDRARRVKKLEIRPLAPEQRARFTDEWRAQQQRFVDEPRGALVEADHLIAEVLRVRGYPMADFDQSAADISVDHPQAVQNYRAAHAITMRDERGEASTEDLRKAMVYFRNLFEDLVGESSAPLHRGARA